VKVKKSDHKLFAEAAVKAVKNSKFQPATKNGKPVAASIDIPVKFVLES